MEIGNDRIRVILAEEDVLQRQLIREYLEIDSGYDVLEADDLGSLLELCRSESDGNVLLLLDLQWLEKDGVKLLREVRKRCPELPILGMLEPRPMPGLEAQDDSYGIPFLRKPFSPSRLHQVMISVLKTEVWERFGKKPEARARADMRAKGLPRTLHELLDMAWQQQAEELGRLSDLELEILFSQLNRMRPPRDRQDVFERFFLAVFSIIRDRREAKTA
jgi:DNA-binding NtrC family response regulator